MAAPDEEDCILEDASRGCPMQEYTNESLYRQIVDETQDAIIFANRGGRIELWNSGAESIFGYSAEEAMGQSLDLIIPEKLRTRHWEGYHKVMASGSTRYSRELLAVPAIRKDGTRISIEFSILLVRSSVGEVLGSSAIVRDVTARWQKERELKDRLAALERIE
jgi:PAS domain S-box-containing protein